jgi:hypothetical protein
MNANEGVNTTTPTVSTNSDLGFATNSNYQNLANCRDFYSINSKMPYLCEKIFCKKFCGKYGGAIFPRSRNVFVIW